ncbi:MAG: serpin family protein [Bacteroidales bacterium]|nr:serpin family protein [Bacteroidales bacterium]
MKKFILMVSAVLSTLLVAGCSDNDEKPFVTCPVEPGETPIPLEYFTLNEAETQVNAQTLDFSFRFFQHINAQEVSKNVVLSPLSAEMFLALIANGTATETREQIMQALGFEGLEIADLNSYNRLLLDKLPSIDNTTTLALANGLWAQQDFPFKPTYYEEMTKWFDASIKNMDFNNPTAVCDDINQWCNDNTHGCIPKVIDELSPDAVMILANALYFKGTWTEPFDATHTKRENFTTQAGTKVKVDMMSDRSMAAYFRNDDFGAIQRPYGNGAYSMWLLLPHEGKDINTCLANLDGDAWQRLRQEGYQGQYNVNLRMPRFELKYNRTLTDDLRQMGMPLMFEQFLADFSNMSDKQLYLDFVKQFTYIKVEEKGTEAAAVTIGGVNVTTSVGSDPLPLDFFLDRPFAFLITEYNTGAILFAGKVVTLEE